MKITLVTSGGLAAGLRLGRPPAVVDSATLSEPDARRLRDLVGRATAERPENRPAGALPDAMSYTITVEDDGLPVTLRQSDADMSDAFAALLEWLEVHAEAK